MHTEPSLTIHGPGQRQEFTVREFAAREQVTERSVRIWIAKGAITVRRTPGGGIRIVTKQT